MKFKFRGIFIIYFILIILLIVSYRIKDTMEKNANDSVNLFNQYEALEFDDVSYVYKEDTQTSFNFMIKNNQGNYTIIGQNYCIKNDRYTNEIFFLELDQNYNIINKKNYESTWRYNGSELIYLKQLADNNYILVTSYEKITLDSQGNIIEQINNTHYIKAQDTSNGYILFLYNFHNKLCTLEKYNQYGNLEFEKEGDYGNCSIYFLEDESIIHLVPNETVAKNGDIIAIGSQRFSQQKSLINGIDDFIVNNSYVERIDGKTGDVLWKTEYGGNNYVLGNKPNIIEPNEYEWVLGSIELLSVMETDDENLIVLGRYHEEDKSLFIAKLDKNGNKLGEKIISDSSKIITSNYYKHNPDKLYLYQNDDNIMILGSVSFYSYRYFNHGYIINIDLNNDFNIDLKTYDRDFLKNYNYNITAIRIIRILILIAVVYEIIRFLDPYVKRRNARIPSEDYIRDKYAR